MNPRALAIQAASDAFTDACQSAFRVLAFANGLSIQDEKESTDKARMAVGIALLTFKASLSVAYELPGQL